MPPKWDPDFNYIRTSSATIPILPSASTLSKSPFSSSSLEHLIERQIQPPPSKYSLDALIRGEGTKSEIRVGNYISQALKVDEKDKILVSHGLVLFPDVKTIPVKSRKMPDIAITNETGTTFFICEVDSDKSYECYPKACYSSGTNAGIAAKPASSNRLPLRVLLPIYG